MHELLSSSHAIRGIIFLSYSTTKRKETKENSPLHKAFLYRTFPLMEKYQKIKAKRMLQSALGKAKQIIAK
jgi:hypothetical protein